LKEAGAVRTECSETKNVAENLRDEVDALGNQVSGISTELSEAEFLLSDDDVQVKTALEKASEAQTNAKQAYAKVQNALNTVREIQLTLDNLDNISKLILHIPNLNPPAGNYVWVRAGLDRVFKLLCIP